MLLSKFLPTTTWGTSSLLLSIAYHSLLCNADDYPYPEFRFTQWSQVSDTVKFHAQTGLGYNQQNWNNVGTNTIELNSFSSLTTSQSNAGSAMGFNENTWDCYQNHFIGYDWSELETYDIDQYWATLGWDATSWVSSNEEDYPDSWFKPWAELSSSEQTAAEQLCYEQFIWDQVPLNSFDDLSNSIVSLLSELCFSGLTTVEVQNKGTILMKDLSIGDLVRVVGDEASGGDQTAKNKKFEPVYSFAHYDPHRRTEFLLINGDLRITRDHMLLVEGRGFIPASLLEVGNEMVAADYYNADNIRVTDTDLENSAFNRGNRNFTHTKVKVTAMTATNTILVRSISQITSQDGIFAPMTPSGTIVVNGLVASCYTSLQANSGVLELVDGIPTGITFQWLIHSFQFPHRLVCYHLGSCPNETYSTDGVSSWWVDTPLRMSLWFLNRPEPSTIFVAASRGLGLPIMFLVMFPILLLFSWMEAAMTSQLPFFFLCFTTLLLLGILPVPGKVSNFGKTKRD